MRASDGWTGIAGLAGRWGALLALGVSLGSTPAAAQKSGPKVSEERKARAIEALEEGIAAIDGGDAKRAKSLFEKAMRIDPTNPHGYYELAGVHVREKDYERALKAVERGRAVEPEFPGFYVVAGNVHDVRGEWKKARKEYETGIERNPGYPDLYVNLGVAQWNRGDREDALETWHRGVHAAPRSPSLHYHLARGWSGTRQGFNVLLYGEGYLNLDRASDRSEEMSSLLFKALRPVVSKDEEGEYRFMLTKTFTLAPTDLEREDLPAGMTFEFVYGVARVEARTKRGPDYTTEEERQARSTFLDRWFGEERFHAKYDLPLFRRWRDLRGAGHLEAYVRWILRAGFPEEFAAWKETHQPALDALFEWFDRHPYLVDEKPSGEGKPRSRGPPGPGRRATTRSAPPETRATRPRAILDPRIDTTSARTISRSRRAGEARGGGYFFSSSFSETELMQ